jgi:TonB family protein
MLLACVFSAPSNAQGLNLPYATRVTITYRAINGRVPAELKIYPPAYPPALRHAGLSGEVEFELTVQNDGSVSDIVITKASEVDFKPPVKEALASWKFLPRRDGIGESPRPLRLVGRIQFQFADE